MFPHTGVTGLANGIQGLRMHCWVRQLWILMSCTAPSIIAQELYLQFDGCTFEWLCHKRHEKGTQHHRWNSHQRLTERHPGLIQVEIRVRTVRCAVIALFQKDVGKPTSSVVSVVLVCVHIRATNVITPWSTTSCVIWTCSVYSVLCSLLKANHVGVSTGFHYIICILLAK